MMTPDSPPAPHFRPKFLHRVFSPASHITLTIIVLILLLAAGLRFHLLGAQSLWHDEGNSYVQATRSFADIADNASRDIHPPGYYWLLKIWRGLLGETEFGLRSLSAMMSIVTVAFTYALGRSLFGRLAGLSAAAFVALNTFSIFYAQEARMYAALALWSAASMWTLVGLLTPPLNPLPNETERRDRRLKWALALGLFNAAGLYTQYAFPFVMIAQGVLFLFWYGSRIWRSREPHLALLGPYVGANLLAILIFLPWMGTAWEQVTTWPNTGTAIPTGEALATLAAYFAFGITRGMGTTIPVLFFLLFGLLMLPAEPPISPEMQRRRWWRAMVPVVWVVVPVGLFLALGLFREANLKLLLPAQIGFALWMARGVHVMWNLQVRHDSGWRKVVPKAAVIVAMVAILVDIGVGLNPLYHDPAYRRDDYRAIVATISANPRPDDAVILNAPNQQEVFNYYYDGAAPVYPIPQGLGGDDDAALADTRRVINNHERIFAVLWATEERDPNGVVENALDSEAFEIDSTWYGDVRLVRYVAPARFNDLRASDAMFGESIRLDSYALSDTVLYPGDVLQIQLNWLTEEALPVNYKVFVQLLSPDGVLVAQRDAQPGGGQFPTSTWQPSRLITDNHALMLPNDLPASHYALIVGLYNPDNPLERLPTEEGDYLQLGRINVLQTASD